MDLAQIAPFDLVVIDLHMPGIDGDEATRRLRACGRSRLAFIARWGTDPIGRLDQGRRLRRCPAEPASAASEALGRPSGRC